MKKQTTAKKRQTKIYAVNEHSYVPPKKNCTKNDTIFFILFLTSFFYMLVVFLSIPLILSGFSSFPNSLDCPER